MREDNKQIKRFPRPAGTTLMAMNINSSQNKEKTQSIKELQTYVLKQYINQGFQYQGQTLDIEEMALILGMNRYSILKRINQLKGHYLDVTNRDSLKMASGVVLMKAFEGTLHDRTRAEEVYNRVLKAHGPDGFKPFMTKELNSSVGNLMNSQKMMQSLIQLMGQLSGTIGPNTNIQINNKNEAITETHNNYLTVEKAVNLITEDGNQENEEGILKLLANQYIKDLPIVDARKQQGYKADGMVLVNSKKKLNEAHDNRREVQEGGIVS